jgi:hypothetical protein
MPSFARGQFGVQQINLPKAKLASHFPEPLGCPLRFAKERSADLGELSRAELGPTPRGGSSV